jgi:UDP-N-acetylmuramate--alanine ligase
MDENKDIVTNHSLLNSEKIFFLGICGIGMSALAQYIKIYLKKSVIGSDINLNSDVAKILTKKNIPICLESEVNEDIIDSIDVLVITNIVFKTNAIVELAKKKNKIIIQRSKLLKEILKDKKIIGITGSHGKTSTTGLTIKIFHDAKLYPLGFIGGIMPEFKNNFIEGEDSSLAIIEADEAFKSFLDLNPYYAIITNISAEHLETYKNLEDVENNFLKFTENTSKNGAIIINIDNARMKEFVKKIKHPKIISYGLDEAADIRITNISLHKDQSNFDLYRNNKKIETFFLSLPGIHNIKNATASIIVALENNISLELIKKSLEKHEGVKRRFEFIGITNEGISVYDDYGHHPNEINATLNVLDIKGIEKVYLFFQLHRYSRTEQLWDDFITTLEQHKDKIACLYTTDIYSGGEVANNNTRTALHFVAELKKKGINAQYFPLESCFDKFFSYQQNIKNCLNKEKIIILTLGAGIMNNFAHLVTKKVPDNKLVT